MNPTLPETFRALRSLTERLAPGQDGAAPSRRGRLTARVVERLERDLLPRTAGAHEHLVVGIVGPNNAGKSQLFNSLIGRRLSPSLPQGGATRRLIGATGPELHAALLGEPSLAQFPLVPILELPPGELTLAGENADDPAELLLVRLPELAPGVLLIDAPDFDSILSANRRASESLLQVVDLALVVVTRHTYHNELVVSFLEGWLRHGRPWALVYNEAYEDQSITAGHAEQLATELGSPPVAVFHAPFDIELQRGTGELVPRALDGQAGAGAVGELGAWLFGEEKLRLKQRALSASCAGLAAELEQLALELERERDLARALLEAAHAPALAIGRAVAARAMPPGPFLEAFRRVADRRIAGWRRNLRAGTRRVRLLLEGLGRAVGGTRSDSAQDLGVAQLEARELAPEVGPFLEQLNASIGLGANFWTRPPADPGGTADQAADPLADRVARDLASAAAAGAPDAAQLGALDERLIATFETTCEELIEAELDRTGSRRAGEAAVQFGVDLLHSLPIFAGVGTAIATGGVGIDVATLLAGGLGSAMAERFTKFLGTGVARAARRRWQELRGAELAETLVALALPSLVPELQRAAAERADEAAELRALASRIAVLEPTDDAAHHAPAAAPDHEARRSPGS